jgi:hypothetical protein
MNSPPTRRKIVNRLELRPGQEDIATPTTYTEEEPGIDPTKTWRGYTQH